MVKESKNVTVLYPSACVLGESPMWHQERQSCFWVDIEQCRIYEYKWKDKSISHYDLDHRISLIVAGKGDDLIVGVQGGVGRWNLITQKLTILTDLGEDWTTHRTNDGICDEKGNLWISSMALDFKKEAGSVYCVQSSGQSIKSIEKLIEKATIPNGMAWSADQQRLYYIDSPTKEVHSYLYDDRSGVYVFEKIVVRIPADVGIPDGMTIDVEGLLWIALWGGSGVARFDLDTGDLVEFIHIPAPYVTSCTFAGEKLDQLVITTARGEMTAEDLLKYPESGHTFVLQPGVSGVPDFVCTL